LNAQSAISVRHFDHALSALLGVSLFVAAPIASARADIIPVCTLPSNVTSATSLNEAPAALRQALKERVGGIVAPDEKFDSTDIVLTGRNRHLIFVWNVGRRWIVATEHGGRGYNDPIFAYDLSEDSQTATLVEERTAFPNTVCAAASGLLSTTPK